MNIIESNLKWNGNPAKRTSTDCIVIHNADAVICTVEDVHRWHLNNGWIGIGYHFFVRKDGKIYRGRPIDTVGAHCLGYNSDSVGVCFEGKYHSADRVIPAAQLESGWDLVNYLKEIYPKAKIMPHKALNDTDCPGQYFPFEELCKEAVPAKSEAVKTADFTGHWAEAEILKVIEAGVMVGDDTGGCNTVVFRPDDPLTRAEMAVILCRKAGG